MVSVRLTTSRRPTYISVYQLDCDSLFIGSGSDDDQRTINQVQSAGVETRNSDHVRLIFIITFDHFQCNAMHDSRWHSADHKPNSEANSLQATPPDGSAVAAIAPPRQRQQLDHLPAWGQSSCYLIRQLHVLPPVIAASYYRRVRSALQADRLSLR